MFDFDNLTPAYIGKDVDPAFIPESIYHNDCVEHQNKHYRTFVGFYNSMMLLCDFNTRDYTIFFDLQYIEPHLLDNEMRDRVAARLVSKLEEFNTADKSKFCVKTREIVQGSSFAFDFYFKPQK